ncbi:MAG: hypothetical protein ABR911_02480 [Syntrophales bacterium]
MKTDGSSYLFLFILCLTGGILGFFVSQADPPYHRVTMKIESSKPVETQLFYDTGKGFNENDSIKQVVYQTNIPVILDFSFPGRNIRALRFDPSRAPAQMKIYDITIRYRGEQPFRVPLNSLLPSRDIVSLQNDGNSLTLETTVTAEDPILLLTRIGPAPHTSKLRILMYILAGVVIALGIAFFFGWVYRNGLDEKDLLDERNLFRRNLDSL